MRIPWWCGVLACGLSCSAEKATPAGHVTGGRDTGGTAEAGGGLLLTGGAQPESGGSGGGGSGSGGSASPSPSGGASGANPQEGTTGGTAGGGGASGGTAGSGGATTENTIDPCAEEARFVVASFNIRYAGGNSLDENAWNNATTPRRERVVSTIVSMAPDLLGVQEALALQVDDLREALPEYAFVGVGRDDGERAGEFAGVFYREQRYELLEAGNFWLSTTPEVPGTVFAGSGSIRMATWVRLKDVLLDQELFFLNTHWDNVSQSSREASASLIRERLDELAAETPTLLTGDLNQGEDNVAVRTLLGSEEQGALLDAYRRVHPVREANELTFHDFQGSTAGSRIDYVLSTVDVTPLDATIVRDDQDGLYPSDHYPVRVTFAFDSRCMIGNP